MKNLTAASGKSKSRLIAFTALVTAMVFIVTSYIKVPIPLGYFNIGNSFILMSCLIFPSPVGIIAGAFGSALADFIAYPVYTVPTLIIKSVMPFLFYLLMKWNLKSVFVKQMIAMSLVTLIPLFGYTWTGMILYGGFAAGLAQVPGLLIEYIANIIIFGVLASAINRSNVKNILSTI